MATSPARERRRLVKRARHLLDKDGTTERVDAARASAAFPAFHGAMAAALARRERVEPIRTPDDIATLVREVLAKQFGVDMTDVQTLVQWDPETRGLGLSFRPHHAHVLEVVQRAKTLA